MLGDEEEMEEGRPKLTMDSCTFINKYSEFVMGQLGWPFGLCEKGMYVEGAICKIINTNSAVGRSAC